LSALGAVAFDELLSRNGKRAVALKRQDVLDKL
jgi:hypothetical protein